MTTIQEQKSDTAAFLENNGLIVFLMPSRRKTIKKTKVVLEGVLTINTVKVFLEKIKQIFESYDFIDFHLQSVDIYDLSFIQALYHLKVYYTNHGKTTTINAELSEDLKKIIIQSGFERIIFKAKNV